MFGALGALMKLVIILLSLFFSAFVNAQNSSSSLLIKTQLNEVLETPSENYIFYDDFFQISRFSHDQSEGNYSLMKKSFQTMFVKSKGKAFKPNIELLEIYNELNYLIKNEPEEILIPLHTSSYVIESSYLGNVIKLILHEEAVVSENNIAELEWLNRSQAFQLKVVNSIANKISPNKKLKMDSENAAL